MPVLPPLAAPPVAAPALAPVAPAEAEVMPAAPAPLTGAPPMDSPGAPAAVLLPPVPVLLPPVPVTLPPVPVTLPPPLPDALLPLPAVGFPGVLLGAVLQAAAMKAQPALVIQIRDRFMACLDFQSSLRRWFRPRRRLLGDSAPAPPLAVCSDSAISCIRGTT